MARELKLWLAALVGGMGLVAVAFVPPRGAPAEGDTARRTTPWSWATPERRRVEELATAWRAVQRALLAARYRDAAEPWPAPDSLWRRLGLGSDIRVTLAVVPDTIPRLPGRPHAEPLRSRVYLLPSAGGRTCAVLLPERRLRGPFARVTPSLTQLLGPCAYYSAFGPPGHAIEEWLRARRFDVAYQAEWASDAPSHGRPAYLGMDYQPTWYLRTFYGDARFEAIACAGGRAAACRAELLRATVPLSDNDRAGIVATDYWWLRRSLAGADLFLSDLVTREGPERFRRFWRSTQLVDEAFATAFGEPIGDWTRRWQRSMLPEIPLGAPVNGGTAALGLLTAGVAVTVSLLLVRRRQVL